MKPEFVRRFWLGAALLLAVSVAIMRMQGAGRPPVAVAHELVAPVGSPPGPITGELRGQVTDAAGDPYPGATVLCVERNQQDALPSLRTRTDAEGRFTFSARAVRALNRPFGLIVVAKGGIAAMSGPGGLGSGIDIQLSVASSTQLRIPVSDTSGRPLGGVGMQAAIMIPEVGWYTVGEGGSFVSRPDGWVTVPNLPRNRFARVTVTDTRYAPIHVLDRIALRQGPVRTFHPVHAYRAGRIQGTVVFPDGKPAADRVVETLRIDELGPGGYSAVQTDAKGRYQLDRLVQGTYVVRVRTPGDDSGRWACRPTAPTRLAEGATVTASQLKLERGARLFGRARSAEEGMGIAGVRVLVAFNPTSGPPRYSMEAISGRTGAFSVCVPAGHVRVGGVYYTGDAFLAMRSRVVATPAELNLSPGGSYEVQLMYYRNQGMTGPTPR